MMTNSLIFYLVVVAAVLTGDGCYVDAASSEDGDSKNKWSNWNSSNDWNNWGNVDLNLTNLLASSGGGNKDGNDDKLNKLSSEKDDSKRWDMVGGGWGKWDDNKNEPNETLPSKDVCSMATRLDDICVGELDKTSHRFFYDSKTKKCKLFIGCKPETPGNNFQTVEACGQVCEANVTSVWTDIAGQFGIGGGKSALDSSLQQIRNRTQNLGTNGTKVISSLQDLGGALGQFFGAVGDLFGGGNTTSGGGKPSSLFGNLFSKPGNNNNNGGNPASGNKNNGNSGNTGSGNNGTYNSGNSANSGSRNGNSNSGGNMMAANSNRNGNNMAISGNNRNQQPQYNNNNVGANRNQQYNTNNRC